MGWVSDEVAQAGLKPQLSNCYKVEQMRKARGSVKTNKKDATCCRCCRRSRHVVAVWRAPAEVRDRREWMRYRADV